MHSPTLLILVVILMGVMVAALFIFWHFNRRIPGLRAWMLSYLFGFVLSLNFLPRVHLPETLSVVIAQFCMLMAAYLCLLGSQAYMGTRAPPHRYALSAIAALVALSVYFTVAQPNTGARFLIGSLGPGIFFLLSARTMAKGEMRSFPTRYLFAMACGGHGLFLLVRPWLFKLGANGLHDSGQVLLLSQFVLLESIVNLVLMAFGILMLANEFLLTELRDLAEKDPLTNVFNRRAFLILLDKAMSMAQRTHSALPVLLMDLDHFKKINDTWGHQCGDEVLRHFVGVVTNCLRNEDVMGRIGGEEFSIFLPTAGLADATAAAERLCAAVTAKPVTTAQGTIYVTVSIGVTLCAPGDSSEIALHRADQAMYLAKERGRNRVEIFQPPARPPNPGAQTAPARSAAR